jgi:sulfur-oxidizing protein SoxZ
MAKFKVSKVKAKAKNGVCDVQLMFSHPMMTYNQAEKKTGNKDDANFITHITGTVGDEVVLDISTSQFLSKNPIIKSKFKCDTFKAGDELKIVAQDRKGATAEKTGKIKGL